MYTINRDELGEYTNWSGRKTFIQERNMVISALENDDYEQIKEYLKPLVLYWYEHFKNNTADFKLTKGEAIDASFKYLKTGLEKYHERLETEKTGFKFSSYFEWFIRQALIERAKENNK